MRSNGISLLLCIGFSFSMTLHAQDNGSVGIGIENPNPNAILHLVSPGNNQGLLIPSMTTAQRTSSIFMNELDARDNGLMVFDLTEKIFYFWRDTNWQTFSSGSQSLQYDQTTNQLSLLGGNTIDLSSLTVTDWNDLKNTPADFLDGTDEVDDADADPTNEIQDLSISGTILSITGNDNATPIDLSGLLVSNSFDGSFESLTGVPSDLADGDQVEDADADSTNEIQSLQWSDGVLTLAGDLTGTVVDLSLWDQDASDDFDGQFGSLTGIPEDLADGDQVDDADADPLNEIQTMALENDLLTLSGGGGTVSINDADADPSNESISMVTLEAGNTLRIRESGTDYNVDLTSLVDDLDADPTNEIQSLTYNSVTNFLTLTKPNGNDVWDLSELDDVTPWIEENNGTNINYTGKYVISNNMISRSNPNHVSGSELTATAGALKGNMINDFRSVIIVPGGSTINLRNIDPGVIGQELFLVVIGPGTLNVDGANGNIFLSSATHSLTTGSSLHLVYFKDQFSGTNFDGWMEMSVSVAAGR